MSWLKIDDGLFLHPKWLRTPPIARALWITALGWSSLNQTRGWIDRDVLLGFCEGDGDFYSTHPSIIALIESGLISLTSAGHYQVCDMVSFDSQKDTSYLVHKESVFSRDGYACVYCGSPLNLSLDHVIPQSRGGEHSPSNLVTACRSCNSSKGAKTPEEWKGVFNALG